MSEEATRALKAIEDSLGGIPPGWRHASKVDPRFAELFAELYRRSASDGVELSAKVKEFVIIAVLLFRGTTDETIIRHMETAIGHGATMVELLEVVQTAFLPGGATTLSRGLAALEKLAAKSETA